MHRSSYTFCEERSPILAYKDDVGRALSFANSTNTETIHLMKTAKVIRRDISKTKQQFSGVFNSNSEIDLYHHPSYQWLT